MKIHILAIGIHPDDVELSCSGTLLSHIDKGKKVGLLDLSRGELGTRGTPEIREKEAQESAHLMGAEFRINLDMGDGFFDYSRENLVKIIQVIRTYRPEIVLANALTDRHPDHGKAAKLEADACYYSGLMKIPTYGSDGELQERWRPRAVYHYVQDYHIEPDFVFDITPYIDRKFDLIRTFRSQFYVPEAKEYSNELSSPISSKDFLEFLRSKNAVLGRPADFKYAEGFNVNRYIGVNDLFDLS